jgi:hypothetical protein
MAGSGVTPQQHVAALVAEAGRGHRQVVVDRLVERVRAASVPGRGTESSAPLRLASGVLAEELLCRDPGPDPAPRRPVRAPRRGVLLVGAPCAVAATRVANGLPLLPPVRPTRVVVLARPLDEAIADVWASQVWATADRTWGGMIRTLVDRDRLPRDARAVAIARHWARRVGADRVHLVTRPGVTTGITRTPLHVVHPPVRAADVELVRRVSETLGILAEPATHVRVLDRVLRPLLAAEEGPAPGIRPDAQPWLDRHAVAQADAARRGRYALHGDPADLAPSGAGSVMWPGSTLQEPVTLAVAVRALLALCEESP